MKVNGTQDHGLMHIGVFGQDGKEKRTAVWGVTDGAYGPRLWAAEPGLKRSLSPGAGGGRLVSVTREGSVPP